MFEGIIDYAGIIEGLLKDGFRNGSIKHHIPVSSLVICIYTEDESFTPKYAYFKGVQGKAGLMFVDELSFNKDILGVKLIDLLMREATYTPFITAALQRVSSDFNISHQDVSLTVVANTTINEKGKEVITGLIISPMRGANKIKDENNNFIQLEASYFIPKPINN